MKVLREFESHLFRQDKRCQKDLLEYNTFVTKKGNKASLRDGFLDIKSHPQILVTQYVNLFTCLKLWFKLIKPKQIEKAKNIMNYVKFLISFVVFASIAPTMSFAQDGGTWGYGSYCLARDCAKGKEPPAPFRNAYQNMMGPTTPAEQAQNEAYCTQYVKNYCGGVGYSSPNRNPTMIQWCSNGQVATPYANITSCPAGQSPLGPAVADY